MRIGGSKTGLTSVLHCNPCTFTRCPVCFHSLRVSIERAGSPFSFPQHRLQKASLKRTKKRTKNPLQLSHFTLSVLVHDKNKKKTRRHVLHPCASLTSPVGLVEAAMVAAPEAGVSTLSMAQSRPLCVFTPTAPVVHCVVRVAANLSSLLRRVRREKLTDKQLGACLLYELTKRTH